MGQFSWCCGLCDQEVMHGRQPGYEWTKHAAILWPNGDIRRGVYEEGYGNIAGIDLVDQMGGWRLVHQRCYTGQPFDSLKPERHASDQGWWPGERIAVIRYGEPDHSELTEEKTYVCYECKSTWQAKWSGGLCPFGCVRPKNYRDSEEVLAKAADPNESFYFGDHHEMVEPFRYLSYGLDHADGVIVCRNEKAERPDWPRYHEDRKAFPDGPPTKIEPCFYFGEPQQARVTKPEEWDEFERPDRGEFVVRCSGCKTDEVEIVPLKKAVAP